MSGPAEYLLDTNVLFETRKRKCDSGVISFLESAEPSTLYISVLTLGELRKGIAAKQRTDVTAARSLAAWAEGLELSFADRLLAIDAHIVRLWGELSSDRSRPVTDTLLAATAIAHGMTLVTRNLRDVRGLKVKVLNPWTE